MNEWLLIPGTSTLINLSRREISVPSESPPAWADPGSRDSSGRKSNSSVGLALLGPDPSWASGLSSPFLSLANWPQIPLG